MESGSSSPARQVARIILLIIILGLAISITLRVAGQTTLALQVCIGAVALSVVMLLVGAVVVAVHRPQG